MNRRHFLASLLATPVVASLPDVQRPTLAAMFHRGGTGPSDVLARLAEHASHLSPAQAFALGKAARLAQNAIDGALAVREALAAGVPPAGTFHIVAHHHIRGVGIALEAPPGADMAEARMVLRDEPRPHTPLRIAVMARPRA